MMKKMKRTITLILSGVLGMAAAGAQESSAIISYALPRTVLTFEVKATQTIFYAGPYARYAQKYLGIQAGLDDKTTFAISEVALKSASEADQSKRYSISLNSASRTPFFQMTAQGLIAGQSEASQKESGWAFPAGSQQDFAAKGLPANLTSASNTLYDKTGGMVVQQSLVVEKSLEKKAQEVAEMIFKIRDNKYKILVGDTDATYSGEAMKATIDELTKMEENYLTLFTGYSETRSQSASFELVPTPDAKSQVYVAFRLSDSEGLVAADNMAGKPYFAELVPESIAEAPKIEPAKNQKLDQQIIYRIPAVCSVRLTDGVSTLLQSRIPVYQLGIDETYPIYTKK